jgi:hypothetical protein
VSAPRKALVAAQEQMAAHGAKSSASRRPARIMPEESHTRRREAAGRDSGNRSGVAPGFDVSLHSSQVDRAHTRSARRDAWMFPLPNR